MNLKELYWKIPYNWRLGSLWYRIKCFCWYRYTTIKPRYLDHTWCDRCALLPHMMFEILSQFIEKECSPGHIDWDATEHHKNARKEMQELYDWWNHYYNKQYTIDSEAIWKEIEKHSPTVNWIPTEADFIEWSPQWDNDADKQAYNSGYKKLQKFEDRVEKELEKNLHRLITIMPYMWT